MKGKFVVIEGLDGCGKSTQVSLLQQCLQQEGIAYKFIHFPMLNQGLYGTLIAEFLRGEFGSLEEVHPKLVALLYANDRMEHIHKIRQWLDEGCFVLADRYVASNIAYQCAKLKDESAKASLKEWILNLEFEQNHLPWPDKMFFLNVPFDFIRKSLTTTREGNDRDYLNGKQDIHESSMAFQVEVYKEYIKMTEEGRLQEIRCYDEQNRLLTKEDIHQRILRMVVG